MADHSGDIVVEPAPSVGVVELSGFLPLPAGGGSTTIVHYALRAHRTSDDTWQTWEDTSVSLTNAPGGAINYDPASLTVQGST